MKPENIVKHLTEGEDETICKQPAENQELNKKMETQSQFDNRGNWTAMKPPPPKGKSIQEKLKLIKSRLDIINVV